MSDVAKLELEVTNAKKAYKANKDDKSLKKAYKAAKKAFDEAKAAAEAKAAKKAAKKSKKGSKKRKAPDSEEAPVKKAKVEVDIEGLKKAANDAKKAYKADKTNADLKKAYKTAKAALAAAESEGTKTEEPKEETKEEPKEEDDLLASLQKKAPAPAASAPTNGATEKIFVSNLSWSIDDDAARDFFKDCGEITDIFWLTDKETEKFKGCGFLTFDSVENATKAVEMAGQELMGREIRCDFAKPRVGGDKGGSKKGGFKNKPLSEKPEGCTTVFAGNLSFDIDDDKMREFCADCGDVKAIRWLNHKDSGDFKGCGFIEFFDTGAVDKMVAKNGSKLLGRDIRLDFAGARPPRD